MISETINFKDNYIDDTNDLFRDINEIDIDELVHDNQTDYLDIDYVDFYKDTTNEDVEYTPTVYIPTTTVATRVKIDQKPADKIDSVYPWIAAVFIMNPDNKQFEYICDGILLSERVVLTTARCVIKANVTVDADNILIIMGKRSLQSMGVNEKVLRVKSIKIHDNFVSTREMVDNDLVIAVLAEPVAYNVDIQPAPLGLDDKSAPLATATTGWHASGPLQPLYLKLQSTEKSRMDVNCNKLFCATLGDSETTCPSYGGLLIERQDYDQWRLKGIASGSPTNTGVCFNKHLTFTKIENYLDWIKESIQKMSSK
ncbi:chymotrypsin-C-like isoform X1 [Cydia pomonella]|uniref:chymotrypsin-C-like isoform X1 n=2 Tax=Cydia pomonella TaxID=82600 RepID=UPI002ADE78E5|nr:chymotrypsin-C-like isoform X1 [Cydia pomonella]